MLLIDKVKVIFSDPYLTYFNDSNALYLPIYIWGKAKTDEHIEITPARLLLMDKNPYAVLSSVSHEIGHKIGPELSKLSGYDLTSNFQQLIDCYTTRESINLKHNQRDEAIADYISSEVLAL